MASKASSRFSSSLAESLKALRGKPPTVLEQSVNYLNYAANVAAEEASKQLLEQIITVDSTKFQLVSLLEQVVHLKKVTLRIGSVRVNKWGKTEILLTELVAGLKALKASQSEIDQLSWVAYNTNDETQKNFLNEKISKGEPTNFVLRLLEIRFGKNNGAFPGNKDPVFGVWQIVKIAPDVSSPTEGEGAAAAPPPAKKRKVGGSKKDKHPSPITVAEDCPVIPDTSIDVVS